MKNILMVTVLLIFTNQLSKAQHSCCSAGSSTMAFADLSKDPAFVKAHAEPFAIDFQPTFGTMVSLKPTEGNEANAFEAKPAGSTGKVILMFHEWWGLNDYIKKEAEKLAFETGATVLALDLYDGKIAETREEAGALMGSLDDQRVRSIIAAGIDYAGKMGKIQTIGWCMGGGWSLQAAMMAGDKAVGCVMYYGMPETNSEKYKNLQAPVLAFFADRDNWITSDLAASFEKEMRLAGKSLDMKSYNAMHAFANPSNPDFDKVATADAHQRALAFIKKNFEDKKAIPEEKK